MSLVLFCEFAHLREIILWFLRKRKAAKRQSIFEMAFTKPRKFKPTIIGLSWSFVKIEMSN